MVRLYNFSLFIIPLGVVAQSNIYAQCGGIGWTGPTHCVPNAVCVYQNPWFSQCLRGAPTATGPPKYWFNFGDSYSQTGFSVTGPLPDSFNPIGNPQFPGHTTTGGENWVGFVTSSYNNSVIYTYNYADAGATIDATAVYPDSDPSAVSLANQVDQFTSFAGSQPDTTSWTSENALFSVWIGMNDIGYTYANGADHSVASDALLDSYFTQVQRLVRILRLLFVQGSEDIGISRLYDIGARNFLFANVPPIDCSPSMLNQSATAQALEKDSIAIFNSKLQERVLIFQSNYTEIQTFFWDTNAQFSDIFANPYYFGFQDVTSYGSASNIFWIDEHHPGGTLMCRAPCNYENDLARAKQLKQDGTRRLRVRVCSLGF